MAEQFEKYTKDVETALNGVSSESVRMATKILQSAKVHNSVCYVFGNGGSAATASHFANDLLKAGHLRAVALNDLVPTMLAYGNDDGWENMFAHTLKNLLLPQDVAVGISCSGFSMNVVNAIRIAKEINLPSVRTIVLTGPTWDSPLTQLNPDVAIHVPYGDIRVQEDCHSVSCHAISGGI